MVEWVLDNIVWKCEISYLFRLVKVLVYGLWQKSNWTIITFKIIGIFSLFFNHHIYFIFLSQPWVRVFKKKKVWVLFAITFSNFDILSNYDTFLQKCRPVIMLISFCSGGFLEESNVEVIIMCLNPHNQLDLSGISALTLWLSVSLWAATRPCGHFHSWRSLVSFSSPSLNSTAKSVFAVLATGHKEAFVQRIQQEIIQISCAALGLYVLAVHVWKGESDLHIIKCLLKLV